MQPIHIIPLLGIIIFFLPLKLKGWFTFLLVLSGCVLASVGAVASLLGVVTAPFIPHFEAISALFVLAISITGISTTLYSIGYLKEYFDKKNSFEISLHYVAMTVLIYSMIYVVAATSRFEFLLWWELMTLCSFMLILFNAAQKEVFHAAVSYLILMHLGFFCILLGMGSIDGDVIWGYGSMPLWCWGLLLVGFGLKAGIFPLHIWLPVAHPAAPAHISALLSGVMIKMGVFGIINITLNVENSYAAGYILFVIGAVTAIFGIAKASMQSDIKKLLAYSSIENIGIIVLAIGMGTIGKACANNMLAFAGYGGALLHILNHSSYKTMLFLSAGSLTSRVHSSSMNQMGGLFKRMPLTGLMFLCALFAICAIPPMSGFFSEYTLFYGMFSALTDGSATLEAVLGIVTLAIVAGLTILTFSKAFGISMLGTPRSVAAQAATEVSVTMIIAYALPLVAIVVGAMLYPYFIFENSVEIFGTYADYEILIDNMWVVEITAGILILLVVGLVILRRALNKKRSVHSAPTWGCAFTASTPQIQYNANAVSSELLKTLSPSKSASPIMPTEVYPDKHSYATQHNDSANVVITRASARILHKWTAKLALFQTGRTNHYILHALLFFVVILLFTVIGLL